MQHRAGAGKRRMASINAGATQRAAQPLKEEACVSRTARR
jgi:hypothetical protein